MSLIRYQTPESAVWPWADRWSSLRDDLNALLELPFWSSFGRQGQLLSGWAPARWLVPEQRQRRGGG